MRFKSDSSSATTCRHMIQQFMTVASANTPSVVQIGTTGPVYIVGADGSTHPASANRNPRSTVPEATARANGVTKSE